jgi:hypothetical protein
MKTSMTFVLFLLLAVLAGGDSSAAQTVATKHVMREKLVHTERILEALMTSNVLQLQEESGALLRIPQDAGWRVLSTPEYARYSAAFVNATQEIVNAATVRDLDAAAVHYTAMTMTCYQCHRYLKLSRIVDIAPAADLSTGVDGDGDGDGQRGAGGARPPSGSGARPSVPGRGGPAPFPRREGGLRPRAGVPHRGAAHGEIYPYPFWPRPPFVPGYPWGPYPGWWTYPYTYGYGYSEWAAEMSQYGRIELEVKPDEALVFVDDVYAGVVDDFDSGYDLVLTPGPHHIEVRLTGFATMMFDVNAEAGHHTKLKGALQPQR